ncbi:MAG: ribbon-helix-helix domain-containing protein [Alphaproteobacteria bacterium]|nr:ribbon-helix-helix domain-containing protein [Alphaproteobacteria bacterium]
MIKKSLSIRGHATSIALEPEFWAALQAMAKSRGASIAALVASMDDSRQGSSANLASLIRVSVLQWAGQTGYKAQQ